jgi:hypothetical protein
MSREKRSRRQFTEQTAAILRRHLVDPVSELCNELSIQPTKETI